jgi:hypothetical protein
VGREYASAADAVVSGVVAKELQRQSDVVVVIIIAARAANSFLASKRHHAACSNDHSEWELSGSYAATTATVESRSVQHTALDSLIEGTTHGTVPSTGKIRASTYNYANRSAGPASKVLCAFPAGRYPTSSTATASSDSFLESSF